MRNTNKIINIALIFTLIGVVFCVNLAYAADTLRVPNSFQAEDQDFPGKFEKITDEIGQTLDADEVEEALLKVFYGAKSGSEYALKRGSVSAGDGVIGIAASLLGAEKVYILEKLSDFRDLIESNANRNGVLDKLDFTYFGKTFEKLAEDQIREEVDIVFTNLQSWGLSGQNELWDILSMFKCKKIVVSGSSYEHFARHSDYCKFFRGDAPIKNENIREYIIKNIFARKGLLTSTVIEAKIYPYNNKIYASFILEPVSNYLEEDKLIPIVLDVKGNRMVPFRYVNIDEMNNEELRQAVESLKKWTGVRFEKTRQSLIDRILQKTNNKSKIHKTDAVILLSPSGEMEGYAILSFLEWEIITIEVRLENRKHERYKGVGTEFLRMIFQELIRKGKEGDAIKIYEVKDDLRRVLRRFINIENRERSAFLGDEDIDSIWLTNQEALGIIKKQTDFVKSLIKKYGIDASLDSKALFLPDRESSKSL